MKDVEQAVAEAVAAGGQDVDVLLKETLSIVSDEHARLLFLAEFVKVCGPKELHVADVESILAPCMPDFKKKEVYFKTVCKIVQEGKEASRADLLLLTEELTDDEVRYWMLDVKGDVMDDLALERQAIAQVKKAEEQKRAKEEQDVRERAEQQARLDAALTNIAERYGQRETMSDNVIREVREMVQGIDAEKIDWMKPVNDILKEPLTPRSEIWKLAGLLLIENPDVKEELPARRRLATSLGLGGTFLGGVGIIVAGLCASDRGSKWLELEVLCSKCAGDFQGARAGIFAVMVDALEKSFDRSEIHTSREKVKKFIEKYLAKRVTFE